MHISSDGLDDLKAFEGCRLDAYLDEGGVWTIGYGDTHNVRPGMKITQEECDARLAGRLREFEAAVSDCITRPMKQGQFDAFVCLAYNIGAPAFQTSTLARIFNEGDVAGAARQFARWIHVHKVISPNLVNRRFAEVVRFFS